MEQTINTHQFDWCLSPLLILSMPLHTFEEKLCCWCKLICHDPTIMWWLYMDVKIIWIAAVFIILIAWLFKRFNSYRVRDWKCFLLWNFFLHIIILSTISIYIYMYFFIIAKAFSNSLNFQVDVPCLNTWWSLFSKHFRIEFLIDSL